MTGGHASPRGCPGGATWQGGWQVKGPRVSGPWLEYWGGNANALLHSTFYTRLFLYFPPCETMSRLIFQMQAMWRHSRRRMRSQSIDHMDPSPRDLHQDTCVKKVLSDAIDW